MSKDILVIGLGEIGTGLVTLFKETAVKNSLNLSIIGIDNKKPMYKFGKPSCNGLVMHVAIPGGLKDFVSIVEGYIRKHSPDLTIIHSTVPVGTTKSIADKGYIVCHSPVRGKHPNMIKGLKSYIKYIGFPSGLSNGTKLIAIKSMTDFGINCRVLSSCTATEAAKILSTSRYGVNLLFADAQKEYLDDLELDYEEVVLEWENSYNKGLKKVGLTQFMRPILSPPNGYIGGHCVYENMRLIKAKKLTLMSIFQSLMRVSGRKCKEEH